MSFLVLQIPSAVDHKIPQKIEIALSLRQLPYPEQKHIDMLVMEIDLLIDAISLVLDSLQLFNVVQFLFVHFRVWFYQFIDFLYL